MKEVNYIIVQAGGKGTRLKNLTANKPKAIVSVGNLPIVFHLFRKFPDKRFIIIGDYKKDVLDAYLDAFADVDVLTVGTDGNGGTCSGIRNALSIVPDWEPFMLIWSDLVIGDGFEMPTDGKNHIGISETFPCRWSYSSGAFKEERSFDDGIAGLFVFADKSMVSDVPESGEFVRYLSTSGIRFERIGLADSAEYGLIESIEMPESGRCRPFNSMCVIDGLLIKKGIDDQGRKLAIREKAWYEHVKGLNVPVPEIHSLEPLTMELIDGRCIHEYHIIDREEKKKTLVYIMDELKTLHSYDSSPVDRYSIFKAYYRKTLDRISKVRNLVPFANEPYVIVNGRRCRNVFFHLDEVRFRVSTIPCERFCLIHGDCTFSNMMLRHDIEPIFIDPRGYFGDSEIVGDPLYDWAKLYYSLVGDYDQFNLGRFRLSIASDSVDIDVETNGWRCMEEVFEENLPEDISLKDVRFVHALIWLSLTTYAWNDYDSICGAFYLGLYYLEDSL